MKIVTSMRISSEDALDTLEIIVGRIKTESIECSTSLEVFFENLRKMDRYDERME